MWRIPVFDGLIVVILLFPENKKGDLPCLHLSEKVIDPNHEWNIRKTQGNDAFHSGDIDEQEN